MLNKLAHKKKSYKIIFYISEKYQLYVKKLALNRQKEMFYIILLFWIYILISFLFSIDYYLISQNIPVISKLIEYKIIVILAISSIAIAKGGIKSFCFLVLEFLFFPIILIWKFLRVIHKKDWYFFLFSMLSGIISFLDGLTYRIINFSFICFSIIFCFCFDNKYLYILSMIFSFLFLLVSYGRALIDSIKTPYFYKVAAKILDFWTPKMQNISIIQPNDKSKNEIIIVNGIELNQATFGSAIITSGLYYFLSEIIDKYKTKNIIFIYNVFLFFYLFICIILSLSIMNYTLWKIDPQEFITTGSIGFFDFIYYSFREMAFADVDNLKAAMVCSKSLQMIDNASIVILCGIIAVAIFTNKNEKFIKENEDISQSLKEGRDLINRKICTTCNISDIQELNDEIMKINDGLYKIYTFLSKKI